MNEVIVEDNFVSETYSCKKIVVYDWDFTEEIFSISVYKLLTNIWDTFTHTFHSFVAAK